jgi:hypothetical protein
MSRFNPYRKQYRNRGTSSEVFVRQLLESDDPLQSIIRRLNSNTRLPNAATEPLNQDLSTLLTDAASRALEKLPTEREQAALLVGVIRAVFAPGQDSLTPAYNAHRFSLRSPQTNLYSLPDPTYLGDSTKYVSWSIFPYPETNKLQLRCNVLSTPNHDDERVDFETVYTSSIDMTYPTRLPDWGPNNTSMANDLDMFYRDVSSPDTTVRLNAWGAEGPDAAAKKRLSLSAIIAFMLGQTRLFAATPDGVLVRGGFADLCTVIH